MSFCSARLGSRTTTSARRKFYGISIYLSHFNHLISARHQYYFPMLVVSIHTLAKIFFIYSRFRSFGKIQKADDEHKKNVAESKISIMKSFDDFKMNGKTNASKAKLKFSSLFIPFLIFDDFSFFLFPFLLRCKINAISLQIRSQMKRTQCKLCDRITKRRM